MQAELRTKNYGHRRGKTVARLVASTFGAVALLAIGTGVASAAPATAPAQMTTVNAESGENAALITWTVPANGGSPITGFQIATYHGATYVGQGTLTAGAVGSSLDPTPGAQDWFELTGLPAGTPVGFTVAAINAIGTATAEGQPVADPSAVPTAPSAPFNVSVSSQGYSATLHWVVAPNNGSAITSFPIQLAGGIASSGGTLTVPAGAVGSALDPTPFAHDSYTFTNLSPGNYFGYVEESNTFGPSPQALTSGAVDGSQLSVTPSTVDLGDATLGDFVGPSNVTVTNVGNQPDAITNITFSGSGADDYSAYVDHSCTVAIAANAQCTVQVYFNPGALGSRPATMTIDDSSPFTESVALGGTGSIGYYVNGQYGEVGAFGDAGYYGDLSQTTLNQPIVGMAVTGDDGGYWQVASDGGIFSFGDAPFYGSTGALHLNKPIVGMAVTPDGGGYWLVASDGGIFSFGDAPFYGSTGDIHLNKPIVGMAVTPDGGGYWLVASDGGIFSFGDAPFYGSTGAIHLNKPIVGMATTPDGGGYWMVASDGGIFAFGNAPFFGSTGGISTGAPIVGISAMPDGGGYWMVTSSGHVYAFGDAPDLGSVTLQDGSTPTDAIGIATDGPPTVQAIFDVPADRVFGAGGHSRHQMVTGKSASVRPAVLPGRGW